MSLLKGESLFEYYEPHERHVINMSSEPVACPRCGGKLWEGVMGHGDYYCKKCGSEVKSKSVSMGGVMDRLKEFRKNSL